MEARRLGNANMLQIQRERDDSWRALENANSDWDHYERGRAQEVHNRPFDARIMAILRELHEADERRPYLVDELALARERAAMQSEDLQSFLAQRYYTGSMQLRVQSGERLQSWQQLFEAWDDRFEQRADAMREVRAALRSQNWARVREIVADELSSSSEEEGEEEEPESDAEMVPEALQQEIDSVLQTPAPARWFTGRVHKLDD